MGLRRVTIRHGSETEDVLVPDSSTGDMLERALKTPEMTERYELAMMPIMSRLEYQQETTINQGDTALFESLNRRGFFNSSHPNMRYSPREQVFNLLNKVRKAVGEKEDEFFRTEGTGGRLLEAVARDSKMGSKTEIAGRGTIGDYLRRISSVVYFVQPEQRMTFIKEDVPLILSASDSFRDFTQRTAQYVKK
jgi:hypothetical protein